MKKALSKRVISILMGGILALALFMSPVFSETSFAADAVSYTLAFKYFPEPEKAATSNITMTISTATLKKGTVITLSGVPSGCYMYDGGYEQVDIEESDSANNLISSTYFGSIPTSIDEPTIPIKNGTISYKLKNNASRVSVRFGSWSEGFGGSGGMDACYSIYKSGKVFLHVAENQVEVKGTSGIAAATATTTTPSSLANASVNNSEFNAQTYYDNYADLQAAIGPNAQALYDHWVKYGKAEGRKAK